MEDKKMYFLYSEDGKEYINTCIGTKELANFLNRSERTVKEILKKIKRKRIKYIDRSKKNLIKGVSPTYLLISEDDIRKGNGWTKPKKKGKANAKKV